MLPFDPPENIRGIKKEHWEEKGSSSFDLKNTMRCKLFDQIVNE